MLDDVQDVHVLKTIEHVEQQQSPKSLEMQQGYIKMPRWKKPVQLDAGCKFCCFYTITAGTVLN